MTETNFEFMQEPGGAPIKAWTRGVQVEDKAKQQLFNIAELPFIYKHVAVMPDVHWGMGATIGSVIATQGAIIPAAVGVDLGCGVIAAKTNLMASDLPDNLRAIRSAFEAAVPHGRTDNGGANDRGAWHDVPDHIRTAMTYNMMDGFTNITNRHPKLERWRQRFPHHLGTLGTGNHFIELCLDENQNVWIMLHSGSRGVGNAIGTYFISRAKEHMKRYFINNLPDADLAYLPEDTQDFNDYIDAVGWAQNYASTNRWTILSSIQRAMEGELKRPVLCAETAINCHHNYVDREHHFGKNVLVTRKGAVRAREGDLGIIPGSMGAQSFIVRGKGNPHSFHSCSHGAGRAMSRGQANKTISLEDHARAMQGIEARLDADVLDESPAAYKPISAVMAAQADLIEIVHTLKQVVNVKG